MPDPQRQFDRFDPETAWQAYYPLGTNPWNAEKVAHLYRRAAFGVSAKTVKEGVDSSPSVVVPRLLRGARDRRQFDDEYRALREEVIRSGDPKQFKALWLHRMLYSPHPLQERMTLFWHNHFATSNAKVGNLRMMQRQQDALRKHALGHFGEMLQEMTRDPAMILWLDSNTNKKGKPNENYAREVFELFSLGVGNYTEKDIQEAARALTGWDVRNGQAVFNPAEHDAGNKTILGRTGPWAAGDVVRIALEQPACARFLVRKIFRELVSETVEPSDRILKPLVTEYQLRNYDTGWLVGRLLRSWVFYSSAAIGQKIKPPVDFLVGTVRMLEGRVSVRHLADVADSLGQSLFYPPSVNGWDGGSDWINSTTLLRRQNAMFEFTRGTGPAGRCDPAGLVRRNGVRGDEATVRFFLELFLQQPRHESLSRIVAHLQQSRRRLRAQLYTDTAVEQQLAREAAHLVGTLPEYQLM
ncbi:MAG: DUF1800 family protein [Planctomycetaceae bacterium]